jgi:hypothetical protein
MKRQTCFAAVRVALIAVTVCAAAARVEAGRPAAGAAIDTAAAAAQASPELVSALSKQIGGTPEQAAGAAGALFGLAKSRLKPGDFSKISKAVPGMDMLLKAAPAMAAAGGGPTDALSQLAGTVGGIPQVAQAFGKLGIKPELVPVAASTLASFVTKSGGANLGSLLAGVLK